MCYKVAMISLHTSPLAHLGRSKTAGGMNVYVRELALELGRRGLLVDIFTRWEDSTIPQIVELGRGARVIHIKAGKVAPLDKTVLHHHLPEFVERMQRFSQQHQQTYNVIHSHYWLSGAAGLMIQPLWEVGHMTMFHTLALLKQEARPEGEESPERLEYEGRIINTVDRICVATPDEKAQIQRFYGVSPKRITIAPCGVNLSRFAGQDKLSARAALHLGNEPVLLFVGRMDPLKGLELLLHTMTLLKSKDTTLVVVGGNLKEDAALLQIRRLTDELGIADRVRFVGAIEQEHLPTYYSAADLCVIPSFYESFGMVAIEAQACGTPVVATKVGGLPFAIADGESGFLISKRTPTHFAEKIDLLLSNPERLCHFQQRSREIAARFSWPHIADKIITSYNALEKQDGHTLPRARCGCF